MNTRQTRTLTSQRGFTLVEIAIVLVIIGLLLGGVLKGQELINSARVKNFANDFRNIPLYVYGYQDRFRAIPGDDGAATTHLPGKPNIAGGDANGRIDGNWNDTAPSSEAVQFWAHVRAAGFASGSDDVGNAPAAAPGFLPTNADGGPIGIESGANGLVAGLSASYVICSGSIRGEFALQLDTTMDNGEGSTGSMRILADPHARGGAALTSAAVRAAPNNTYIVCMAM